MKKIEKLIDRTVRIVLSLNETKRNETKRNETKRNETKRTTICSKIENGRRCSYLVIAPSMLERRVKA